jgi:PKD repeat protein
VFAQFSGSVDYAGNPNYRIGTADGLAINLEDCFGCGLQGFGWQDTGWGSGVFGPVIYFQTTGTQTLRIQNREDGLAIDQIVLSPATYLNSSPGLLFNDSRILPSTLRTSNRPPVVSISATPTTGTSPITVNFTSNASDSDGYIASYLWSFGDTSTSSLPNPTKIYATGTYTATLTVTDNVGATASASVVITVNPPVANQPPQVSVSASPLSGTSPLFVSFGSSAYDPDGTVTNYYWTFGDGGTSTGALPTHTYQSAGSYTARLTVTDNAGASASATVTITVTAPPTSITQLKVLSWNTAFGEGTDAIRNNNRTATYIAGVNPDLVALCEVPPENIAPIVNALSQQTGRTWYYHFVPKYPDCPEGNLILSKFPFSNVGSLYLSYSRSVARVTVNVGGRNINFFATHLDNESSTARYAEVGELINWAANFAGPQIIAGDFNAGPDLSEISRMVSSYYDSWNEAMNAGTAVAYPDNPVAWMTRTRRGRIDYVFYSRNQSTLVLKSSNIPDSRDLNNTNVVIRLGTLDDRGVRPSDHNQMISTFEVR